MKLGNVSAHAILLVGSAKSDIYLLFSTVINCLARPLHGLANQECLGFYLEFYKKFGDSWKKKYIKKHAADTLTSGKVVPRCNSQDCSYFSC